MVNQIEQESREARRRLKMRAATFRDYSQIADLESRFGLDPRPYDEWTHLWQANPMYAACKDSWEIGWVVEDDEPRIVASLGNIPLCYEFAGREIVAATGRGLVAEPAYRSAAVLLLGRVIQQPGIDLYVNTTIGTTSAPSFAAFECRRVPVGIWDQAAFWIPQRRVFFERVLDQKNRVIAKPLSYPLAAGAFVWERITKRSHTFDAEVASCNSFDERFDRFWDELRRNHRHVLLAVRSARVLDWHFRWALAAHRLWIATVLDGSKIAAYAIFERKDNPALGISRMRLVDFQSLDGRPDLLQPLIAWAIERCSAEGIQVLEATGRWLEKSELISSIAPYRRKLPTWTYFYLAHDEQLARDLQNRSAWAPSLYDGDASL